MTQLNFGAIGTSWQIDIFQDVSAKDQAELAALIHDRIEAFDATYSRFREDSLVTRISKEIGTFTFPDDARELFAIYHDLYKRTDGLFTPLIGTVMSDAGYDATYTLKQKNSLQSPKQWDDILSYTYPVLMTKEPVMLDFGAGGKGYLVDLVSSVIEDAGITAYCVDAGGDIFYKNTTPIRIGLEDPENTDQMLGVYVLSTGSICGSAGNRRAWGDFTHIINPKTLTSATDIAAIWVVADTALIADAIATCLYFIQAQKLRDQYSFEYCIVYNDRSVEKSKGFTAELFTR